MPEESIRPERGFSMIEVLLALGIVSFALVAILGLFAVGINSSKVSSEETLIVAMANRVVAGQRTVPYAGLGGSYATNYWFDASGAPLTNATAAQAGYGCTVTVTTNADVLTNIAANLSQLKIEFVWPPSASAAVRQTRTFYIHASNGRAN